MGERESERAAVMCRAYWLAGYVMSEERKRERARARGMRERASVRACDCKREARERSSREHQQ